MTDARLPDGAGSARTSGFSERRKAVPPHDAPLQLRRGEDDLRDRDPAVEAGPAAAGAAGAAVAQPAHEALGDRALQSGRDLLRLDAEIGHARYRAACVNGVERREHEMPGERRLDGDRG